MKAKCILSSALAIALMASGTATAFAAETQDAAASYGYLAGQQRNVDRHAQFEDMAGLTTDEARAAFFEEHGIGGGEYSNAQRLDAEALVEAGIIDQATADDIIAYASSKHTMIHGRYSSDMADMTPDERHTLYAGYENDRQRGDSVEVLLNEGIITQEQADAISDYLN